VTYANPVSEAALGRRRTQLLGANIWEVLPPRWRDTAFGKQLQRTAMHRIATHQEAIGSNGNWFEVDAYPTSRGIAVHFRDVTERRRSTEALRAFALRLEAVQLSERAAIAREIHDVVGQSLTVLRLDASRIASLCTPNTIAHTLVGEMIGLIDDSLRGSRSIAMALHPIALDDLGLVGAIEIHVGHVARRANIHATLDLDEGLPDVGRALSGAAYRVLQESLTNVVRHAHATEIVVRLAESEGNLILEITDNGGGTSASALNSFGSLGLVSMRERAAALDGTLEICSVEPHGTRVTMSLPLEMASVEIPIVPLR
jgi:signal transduction histidine kinase